MQSSHTHPRAACTIREKCRYFISTPQTELADEIARRLCGRLGIHAGKDLDATVAMLTEGLRSTPEIAAIQELRDQRTAESLRAVPRYPGHHSGIDPRDYVIENYGEAIRAGHVDSGKLEKLDRRLHLALWVRLKNSEPPQSLVEFFDAITPPNKRGPRTTRRIEACAAILGTTEEEAGKFFNSVRTGRLGPGRNIQGR